MQIAGLTERSNIPLGINRMMLAMGFASLFAASSFAFVCLFAGDRGISGDPIYVAFPGTLGLIALITVVGLVVLSRGQKKTSPTGPYDMKTPDKFAPATKELEVVSERFLIICPFCGTKNEQGTAICQNCMASA